MQLFLKRNIVNRDRPQDVGNDKDFKAALITILKEKIKRKICLKLINKYECSGASYKNELTGSLD